MILHKFDIFSLIDRKVIIACITLVLSVTIVEIWTVNRLATFGSEMNKLDHAKASLELENQVLRDKIAEKSSLTEIGKQAEGAGFSTVKHVEYLQPAPLALSK